jgi:hypothetical protein
VQTWAAILYALGATAEIGGIWLVVIEFRANQAAWREWDAANPKRNEGGSLGQIPLLNKIVSGLIGKSGRRVVSVGLLVLGVIAGTVGNYMSLYS